MSSFSTRRLIERTLLVIVVIVLFRTWCIQGLFVPVRVEGGSMASTLFGRRLDVTCLDCRWAWSCEAPSHRPASRLVCPNCGWTENPTDNLMTIRGDRLLISRSAFALRPPRRWEVVALVDPERPGDLLVKRIIGLPGESIHFRDGEVFVDDRIARKPLAQQRALAVHVHDTRFPSRTEGVASRWRADDPRSGWGWADGRFALAEKSSGSSDQVDWLTYHHAIRLGGTGAGHPADIINRRGYNQGRAEHPLAVAVVGDLQLEVAVGMADGPGELRIELSDLRERFAVHITPSRRGVELWRNGRPTDVQSLRPLPAGIQDGWKVEFGVVDRQVLLVVNDEVLLQWAYQPVEQDDSRDSFRARLGTQGLAIRIDRICLRRDTHFRGRVVRGSRYRLDEPVRLADDEYYVVGDNSPVSLDSRNWRHGPAVRADQLVGKPLVLHYPSRRARFGTWEFQVPDPGRIRYIR